jgi:hypothetical protein|tara:strand:+ start:402 stop:635 length:234 start_codon:yes stop_codon:yes gene_type:complete
MREIETRFGKVSIGDDNKYFIERMYDDLYLLMEDEYDLIRNTKEYGFDLTESSWKYQVHPLSDEIIFTLSLQLEYND